MISIILPVRNSRDLIEPCLKSIAAQAGVGDPYELLISDNCSTDDTLEFINLFLLENKDLAARTRIFAQKENLGVFGNLNFLLGQCTYDYVHIMCADDYYSGADSLAILLDVVRKRPSVPMFSFDNNLKHSENEHWKLIYQYAGDGVIEPPDVLKFLFAFGCFLGGLSNICLNRRHFAEGQYFDPGYLYYGDIEFYGRSAVNGATLYLCREEVTYRKEHPKSISNTQNPQNRVSKESIGVTSYLYGQMLRLGVKPLVPRLYASYQIAQYYHAGLKSLLVNRNFRSLSCVIEGQRGKKAFFRPAVCILIAILVLPKVYREKLHVRIQRGIVKYLFPQNAR